MQSINILLNTNLVLSGRTSLIPVLEEVLGFGTPDELAENGTNTAPSPDDPPRGRSNTLRFSVLLPIPKFKSSFFRGLLDPVETNNQISQLWNIFQQFDN